MTLLTMTIESAVQGASMDDMKPLAARQQPATDAFEPRQAVEFFKLLADETRLRILLLLHQKGELNVQSLCRLLEQTQPAVSHHLALLRGAGLVELRRAGKHNFYSVVPQRFADIATSLRELWE